MSLSQSVYLHLTLSWVGGGRVELSDNGNPLARVRLSEAGLQALQDEVKRGVRDAFASLRSQVKTDD